MEAGQLLPALCADVPWTLLGQELALPCDRARKKRLIRSKASFFYRGALRVPRLFSELFTEATNADAGQCKTKIRASMPHLLHGKRAGNCIRHVARFIGGPRLQNERRFSSHKRSTE